MTTTRLPVVARLRLPDGRELDCHSDVNEQHADGQWYWWTEGNGGCDCNRSLFLNREYGLGLGEKNKEDDDVPNLPCGDTIELLSLTVDGKNAADMDRERNW